MANGERKRTYKKEKEKMKEIRREGRKALESHELRWLIKCGVVQ